jgi:3-deoxy-7-phosphoheptulonate synthase
MQAHSPSRPPSRVENNNLLGFEALVTPREVKAALPITPGVEELVLRTRRGVRDVLRGVDERRLVVIVGPCSIHDADAAYDYAERLRRVAADIEDTALVLMRTYFEKPRTSVGWKGLINDPHLDGSCDIATGLQRAREILLRINEIGVPCASEALDPITPQYISDLLSWASIGARTTESQTHREMASGLSMPVGFKNGTDGGLEVARNAFISAGHGHHFLGINADGVTAIVTTAGNRDRHLVLRGGPRPNYYREDVDHAAALVREADAEIVRGIMVDTSHGNSSKDYLRQGQVCRDVLHQFSSGQKSIMGLLIESNLCPGRQDWKKGETLAYGVSLTDGCIGWAETEELLRFIARSLRAADQAEPGYTLRASGA